MINPPTILLPHSMTEVEPTEVERFRRAASYNKKLQSNDAFSVNTMRNQHTQRMRYENQIADWESGISSYTKMERLGFGFEEATDEIDVGSGWANVNLLSSEQNLEQQEI